jgi:chromatin segregation and condensation protein Rec8/ScpA/Scc1 (kleisin family)
MQVLNIELAGEYLLMAAVLLEIKSRIFMGGAPKLFYDASISC